MRIRPTRSENSANTSRVETKKNGDLNQNKSDKGRYKLNLNILQEWRI